MVTFKATSTAIEELEKHGYKLTKVSTIVVRLIKVKLADGSTETLITSLLDEVEYPQSIFSDLYFKRWGIETVIQSEKITCKWKFLAVIK